MKKLLWIMLIMSVAIPCAYYFVKPKEKPLPIINPVDVNEETVDADLLRLGIGHKIGAFTFTNQNDQQVSDKQLDGKIWVAEYFFTTCGSICPIMNEQMMRVQEVFSKSSDLRLLSFTVDPEHDTPEKLKIYADEHGAKLPLWQYFTGEKEELYRVARRYFFLLKPAEAANLGDAGNDFIHTNNFVLVDKKRRIRGYYDGTDEKEVDKMIQDIKRLQKVG
jgi:protein SCO1/2